MLNANKAQSYLYPTQLVQLPLKFHHTSYSKKNKGINRPIIVQDIFFTKNQNSRENKRLPKTMKALRTDTKTLESKEKATNLREKEYEYEDEDSVELIESIVKVIAGAPTQEEEEEIENYENYDSIEESNEVDEENEENFITPTLNPPLLNDKFIHNEQFSDDSQKIQSRSFNFTTPNFIRNLTEKFSKPNSPPVKDVVMEHGTDIAVDVDLKEKSQEDYDDSAETSIEGLRAPWGGVFPGGIQSQRETLKQGGLIIQRLRVKNGSIAVAGTIYT